MKEFKLFLAYIYDGQPHYVSYTKGKAIGYKQQNRAMEYSVRPDANSASHKDPENDQEHQEQYQIPGKSSDRNAMTNPMIKQKIKCETSQKHLGYL